MWRSTDTTKSLARFISNIILAIVEYALFFLSVFFSILFIVNSFVKHITTDTSIYLLITRTFIETLNRFTLSHDSKGIVLNFILAPFVSFFGPNMSAVSSAQLITHGIAALFIYSFVRVFFRPIGAATIALLFLCSLHSYLIHGGNGRPEDFALGFIAIAFIAALNRTPGWLFFGGCMVSLSFFLKTTIVLSPAAILFTGFILYYGDKNPKPDLSISNEIKAEKPLLWSALGFLFITIGILIWMSLFDNIHGWYRQCIQWPAEYRKLHTPGFNELKDTGILISHASLLIPFTTSILGIIKGWFNEHRKLSILIAVLLMTEIIRISIEGALWPYTITIIMIPLFLGNTILFVSKNTTRRSSLFITLPFLVIFAPVFIKIIPAEITAFKYRVLLNLPSPYEYMAKLMRASGYQQGDTVLVENTNYELILILNAPRPYPVLPHDYSLVSEKEKSLTRKQYLNNSPKWVVTVLDNQENIKSISGSTDYAYYVVSTPKTTSHSVNTSITRTGNMLSPMLSSVKLYKLINDIGYMKSWRLIENKNSSAPPL